MRFWMLIQNIPWTVFAWTTGYKAREASDAYTTAKGILNAGFSNSSKAQIRAIEVASPDPAVLKNIAIRRWAITIAIQIALFAAILTLAALQ